MFFYLRIEKGSPGKDTVYNQSDRILSDFLYCQIEILLVYVSLIVNFFLNTMEYCIIPMVVLYRIQKAFA